MKRLILTAIIILVPALTLAADMGLTHGHDLDALWARAQDTFDLDREEAVLLLEGREIAHTGDVLTETVHRVVWIRTAVGIRDYADLRIPWNTATATLDVEILRTWRDGRWWPDPVEISETAVVHTLPYAVDRADDYTTMRETMLLHDGVELGCIMETRYTITSSGNPGAGGVFVFPQRDPAVRVELAVAAGEVSHETLNGVGEPAADNGTLTWRLEDIPALKLPLTEDSAAYEPTVAWSTWEGWRSLGDAWQAAMADAAVLKPEQVKAFKAEIAGAIGPVSRPDAVADYLNEMTRAVHYPDRFWALAPRPAWRTLDTAYGHALDRAVLAGALLREAGIEAVPVLLGQGHRLAAPTIARLDDFETPALLVAGSNGLVFLPESGALAALTDLGSRPVWLLGQRPGSVSQLTGEDADQGSVAVTINLEPGDDGWTGSLSLAATGPFTSYVALMSADNFADGPTSGLVKSLLPGAEVTAVRPEYLDPGHTVVRAGFNLATPADGRLELGSLPGALLSRLPHGVHLHDQTRESPVMGLEGLRQSVVLRVKTAGDGPAPVNLENGAGLFRVEVDSDGDWVTVARELRIAADPVPAGGWPDLRALLLAESDPVHGRVNLE